jgi:hypothetical protein
MAENEQVKPAAENTPKTTQSNARLFAMPERYRHGKEVKMHEPEKPKPKAKPVPPPVVKPLAKKPALIQKKHGLSGSTKALIIVGAVLLVVLLIGGYLILRSSDQNTLEPEVSAPVVVEPEQTPEVPEDTSTDEPLPGSSENPFASASTPGVDSDSDGLTDIEETLVYGTNPRLPDSDQDGFLDGNEVFHRYNPNGTQPGTLLEANLVLSLNAGTFTILYPTKWLVLPSEDFDYLVSLTTGEQITLNLAQKTDSQTLSDWYIAQAKEDNVVESITKNSYKQLVSQDQLTSYVDLGDSVLVLNYDTGIKGTVDYLQSFQLMINSVEKVLFQDETVAQ